MLGFYIHTHWGYNHPYAARTWTLEDWENYLGGLKALGYDMFMIWPLLDSMPLNLNPSDRAWLDKLRQVIDMAHERFGMKVALCANSNTMTARLNAVEDTGAPRATTHTPARAASTRRVTSKPARAWRAGVMRRARAEEVSVATVIMTAQPANTAANTAVPMPSTFCNTNGAADRYAMSRAKISPATTT